MPSLVDTRFGELLRHYRLAAGLTQEALAEQAGLSVHGIQKLERGGSQPHRETLRRLISVLALAPDDEAVFRASGQPAPRSRGAVESLTSWRGPEPPDLPTPLTSFIGREQEIADFAELLSSVRLLTLTGVGGCGKTRLALELARVVAPHFPDGVWVVELAPVAQPGLVLQAVATALGVREMPTQAFLQTVVASLKQQRLLLVLDNCEHLLAACAEFTSALLQACPFVRVLATSREALALSGEVSRRVPSLAVPPPDESTAPDRLLNHAAVQLFVERASAVHPRFQITPHNARAIAQVCRRLDGMPLALELAAARVRGLSVDELASRLDQRFRLLTGGSRAALPRQQTLRATIDWSYELLSVPERCLFARLAAFAGPWTVEATEAVCAGDGIDREMVLEVLIRLVEKSLVVADESEDGTQRYRLLDTLRQYAREQLVTTGQADAVHGQHAAFYLELARRLERDLAGPRQTAWIHHVARDESNLRAALDWLEERGDVQQALEIASVLWRSWEVHGYLSAGRSRLAALLALPGAAEPTLARARVLDGAGVLALYQYDLRAARSYFKESLSLYLAHHERRGAAWVLVHLGWLCHDSGRYKAARYFLRRGLALAQAATDDAATARCLSLLGMLAFGERDFAGARALHERSLVLNRKAGNRWGTAWALHVLGRDLLWLVETGETSVQDVQTLLDESVAIWRELGERRHQAHAIVDLGLLAIRRGDLPQARRHLQESLSAFLDLDALGDTVSSFQAYAELIAAEHQHQDVVRVLGFLSGLMSQLGMEWSPLRQWRTERLMTCAREQLGPSVAADAWADGQALSLEQAVALVLQGC